MEFESCFKILASREPHTHEACQEEHGNSKIDNEEVAEPRETTLTDLSVREMIDKFHKLQHERVKVYKDFEKGFEEYKATDRFEAFCNSITSKFQEISNCIIAIEQVMLARDHLVVSKVLRNIQIEEKQKLLIMSALLVEKMRHEKVSKMIDEDNNATICTLMEDSIADLQERHTNIIQRINDHLDELMIEVQELDEKKRSCPE